jgi:hypothetical protein
MALSADGNGVGHRKHERRQVIALRPRPTSTHTSLGSAARQRIRDHFDLPSVVTRYENLYAEMAGGQTVGWKADHHASGVAL